MANPFSYTTFTQAKQQLANRLYDSNKVFYTDAELGLYICEALQTFNALAQYWRGDFTFNTTDNVAWYDLTQAANTLRPYTVTDFDLYTIMEYHLLEPPTGATWTGTIQFDIDDLESAIERRRDEILSTTGCTITRSTPTAIPGQVRNQLSDSVIDIRRIAWFPAVSTPTPSGGYGDGGYGPYGYGPGSPIKTQTNVLWPEDQWSFQAFEDGYAQIPMGTPQGYAISTEPPLAFDTDVAPGEPGTYEVLTVNAGGQLNTVTPTLMPIPTDFCWVLKWGALADLLSKEFEAKDADRASYCNHRYQQGMKLLQMAPAALQIRINGVPLWIDSVRSADEYNTEWQGLFPGVPVNAYAAGLNLIALSPTPLKSTYQPPPVPDYSVTVSVVINAPIPVADGDFVQIPREDYDVMLDYSQHLALFKNGGAEFAVTKELYSRFVRQAAVYNAKLSQSGIFKEELYGNSQREEVMNPRMVKAPPQNDDGE